MVEVFSNDDDRYVRWSLLNPTGFVLNSLGGVLPDGRYVSNPNSMLHRASCPSITGYPPNAKPEKWVGKPHVWTSNPKVCSLGKEDLEHWTVQVHKGRPPVDCRRCNP